MNLSTTNLSTMNLSNFAETTGYRYYTVTLLRPRYEGQPPESTRFWVTTLHEPTCRYGGHKHVGLYGEEELSALIHHGISEPTTSHKRHVFKGCKVCGTASIPDALWKTMAEATQNAQRARARAREDERKAESARMKAQAARATAVREARERWIAQYAGDLAYIEADAKARWEAANPEQAALLDQPTGSDGDLTTSVATR